MYDSYDAGTPFNSVHYDSFKEFCEVVNYCTYDWKPPTYHEVRVTYLKKKMEHTKKQIKRPPGRLCKMWVHVNG